GPRGGRHGSDSSLIWSAFLPRAFLAAASSGLDPVWDVHTSGCANRLNNALVVGRRDARSDVAMKQDGGRARVARHGLLQAAQFFWGNAEPIVKETRKLRSAREATFIGKLLQRQPLAVLVQDHAIRQIQTFVPDQPRHALVRLERAV